MFITNFLPCHRLNGGGLSEVGPDLGMPMNAMEYMTERGLRAMMRGVDGTSYVSVKRLALIGFRGGKAKTGK